jgi:hypothetical protein
MWNVWALSELSYLPIFSFLKNWRTISMFMIAIPMILMAVSFPYFWIFESPGQIYTKDKLKCLIILNKIADINKK